MLWRSGIFRVRNPWNYIRRIFHDVIILPTATTRGKITGGVAVRSNETQLPRTANTRSPITSAVAFRGKNGIMGVRPGIG
jgi:hypothetical protein